MFKSIPIYLKLYSDKIEISRLDNSKSVRRTTQNKFSNERLVLADFQNATSLIISALKEIVIPKFGFSSTLTILVQQMEKFEGGLSPVEIRALTDMCEHCGAKSVIVFAGAETLTDNQALIKIKNTTANNS